MYTFADRGERSVTLRPEGTAGVMRAVIQHGLDRGQLPVKLCCAGPFFRYEKPQEAATGSCSRWVEAIGVDDPALDAEVIAIADEGYRRLGLSGFPAGDHLARRRRIATPLPGGVAAVPVRARPR